MEEIAKVRLAEKRLTSNALIRVNSDAADTAATTVQAQAVSASGSLFQAFDCSAQFAHVEWLGQHFVDVQFGVSSSILVGQECREDHDFALEIIGAQSSHQFEAREARHVVIRDDDIEWWPIGRHSTQGFVAVERGGQSPRRAAENKRDGVAHRRFIVDGQDIQGLIHRMTASIAKRIPMLRGPKPA